MTQCRKASFLLRCIVLRLHDPTRLPGKPPLMLKITKTELEGSDRSYPGIKEQILRFEEADLPACPHCGSTDTAKVQVGVIGRTISIAVSTTKVKLVGNGPKPGRWFCNACKKFFD